VLLPKAIASGQHALLAAGLVQLPPHGANLLGAWAIDRNAALRYHLRIVIENRQRSQRALNIEPAGGTPAAEEPAQEAHRSS